MDEFLSRLIRMELGLESEDDADEGAEPPPVRLYFPRAYVCETWQSFRKHGILPEPGGLNDQAARWWADMRTINARYNWLYDEIQKERQERDVLDSFLGERENVPDVSDLFRE